MNENDLRVRKTRKAIDEAFMELLQKKPLDKITVRELCEKAMISKGTFYKHYKDVYDLYDRKVEEMYRRALSGIEDMGLFFTDPRKFIREFEAAREEYMHEFMILLKGGDRRFMQNPPIEIFMEHLYESCGIDGSYETRLKITAVVAGLLGPLRRDGNDPEKRKAAENTFVEMVQKLF